MHQNNEKDKEATGTIAVEPLPHMYKLSEWLTVREVLEIIDRDHTASLMGGPTRYAARYKLRTLQIGSTRCYFARDVRKMAKDMGKQAGNDQSMTDVEREKAKGAYIARYNDVVQRVKNSRGVPWADYVDIDAAMEIVTPEITTMEALRLISDFRNPDHPEKVRIRTVNVGRTHLYLRKDVENVKHQHKVRENQRRINRLRRAAKVA